MPELIPKICIFSGQAFYQLPSMLHLQLYSSAFRRTAAIVRNRGYVSDGVNLKTSSLKCADSGFTAGAGAFYINFNLFQAMFHSCFGCFFSSHLCSERSAFAAAAETKAACGCPAQNITFGISDSNDSIIESRTDMSYTVNNIFANFFPATRLSLLH